MKKYVFFELMFLFLISLIPFLWVGNGYVILGHDSGFRVNIHHHMNMLWNTFNPSINTGVDWTLYKGFLVIQLPELIFQTLLGSLEASQPVILFLWFFVMAISMYGAMLYVFQDKHSWFIRMYTSLFWVFNFYILQAWFIAERAKFSLYAALPLSIVLFFTVFEKRIHIVRGSILFGLLYFVLNGGGSPPLFGASIVVWIIVWMYLSLLNRDLKRSLKIGFGFFFCFFVFNAYWILPQIDLVRGTYTSALSSEGGIEGLIAWEREISKFASIPNLLRLQGFPDWYNNPEHPYSQIYLQSPLLIVFSFIPILSIVAGVLLFRKSTLHHHKNAFIILLFILLFVGLFFAAGSHSPSGSVYLLLMRKIPGFAIFRSSFFKFAPVLWFSIIVLSGYYLQLMIQKFKRIKRIGVIIICLLILYHFPFFSPNFFKFTKNFTTRVQIPNYVTDMAIHLEREKSIGRVLIVPELDRGFINKPIDTYTWGYYSLDVLPRIVSNRTFIANDSPYEIVQALYDSLYRGEQQTFIRLANMLGITHVLFRGDVKFSEMARTISREQLETILGALRFEKGAWSVYSLDSLPVSSYTTTRIIPLISVQNQSEFISTSAATIQTDWDTAEKLNASTVVIQAECFYCSEGEYNSFIQSITLPLYKVGIRKRPRDENIDSLISSSLFALSEYNHTKSHDSLSEYKDLIQKLEYHVTQLRDRKADFYRARTLSFLLKESELGDENIKRILSSVVKSLEKERWISDELTYRYGITLPADGTYTVHSGSALKNKEFSAGYHRYEISKSETDVPALFFVLDSGKSPETTSKLFVFPYSFDSRWKFEGTHVMANGYSNGWLIDTTSAEKTALVYTPHKIFQTGLVISVVGLVISAIVLIKKTAVR